MSKLLNRLRQEALERTFYDYKQIKPWNTAFFQAIFRPKAPSIPGKGPMDMLHPDIDKLHLPENVYIADWRKYRVEDHPALVKFQKRCHAAGLHDPWLRNDCFQFYENLEGHQTKFSFVTQGLVYGFFLAVLVHGTKETYKYFFPLNFKWSDECIAKYGKDGIPQHH